MGLETSIASLAGGIAGGIIGGIITSGNPLGIATGYSIGSMAAGYAAESLWPTKIDQTHPPPPQPQESLQQISTYGASIPIQYDRGKLAGNIIYMQDIQKDVDRSRHRNDGVRYYEMEVTYTSTFAIAFCEGPIEGIARIWVNQKVFADYRDPDGPYYPSGSYSMAAGNLATTIARAQTYFSVYLGSETQTADPTLVALLGANETPTYRGICYIVFINFPIGEFSGVPTIEIETGTGQVIEFVDYSLGPSTMELGDFTSDGYGNDTLRLEGLSQTYVGATGANAMIDRLYTPSGSQIIKFDYYHAVDYWYDDDFTDAQCYVMLVPTDFTITTGNWSYSQPTADTWMKLFVRKLTTSKVTVATSADGTIVDQPLTGLLTGLYEKNTYRFLINWDTNTIAIKVNDVDIVLSEDFSSSIKSGLGTSYRVIFHLHNYTGEGGPFRYFRNIIV